MQLDKAWPMRSVSASPLQERFNKHVTRTPFFRALFNKGGWGEKMEGKCRHHSPIDFQSTLLPPADIETQICLAGSRKLSLTHKEPCQAWRGCRVGAHILGRSGRKILSYGGLLNGLIS